MLNETEKELKTSRKETAAETHSDDGMKSVWGNIMLGYKKIF